jgi:hypothetical protein
MAQGHRPIQEDAWESGLELKGAQSGGNTARLDSMSRLYEPAA